MRSYLPLVMAIILLTSCAVGYRNENVVAAVPVKLPFTQCVSADSENCLQMDENLQPEAIYTTETGRQTRARPRIGLSLAGGGSKSAPFSLGVIQALVQKGWLQQIDYVSSVSGGSYAAMYLYSSALRSYETPERGTLGTYFTDIRPVSDNGQRRRENEDPASYSGRLEPLVGTDGFAPTANPRHDKRLDPTYFDNGCVQLYGKDEDSKIGANRHLAWVDCYQDILFTAPGGVSKSFKSSNVTAKATYAFIENSVGILLDYPLNVAFDWRKRLSPAQHRYARGIFRTYGYIPETSAKLPVSLHDDSIEQGMNSFTFRRLRTLYRNDNPTRMPVWIINATAATGNIMMDRSRTPYDLSRHVFEMTPFGYGAGKYHYVRGYADDLGISAADAVLASAAFFDTAQRGFNRTAVNLALTIFNMRWGLDIPNYNVSDSNRIAHSFLPWPLYYLNDAPGDNKGPTIHLSDGGQSGDNLGMVSLLRRGMDKLIVVMGEQDFTATGEREGYADLGSLCAVNRYLQSQKPARHLVFAQHPNSRSDRAEAAFDLSQECDAEAVKLKTALRSKQQNRLVENAVEPLKWQQRIWHGQVLPEKETSLNPDCRQPDCAQVYLLMSGLDRDLWQRAANLLRPYDPELAQRTAPGKGISRPFNECLGEVSLKFSEQENTQVFSCPILYYLWEQANDKEWRWPQTGTVGTTYNSSSNMSRAYRSLGYFLGKQLQEAGALDGLK